MAERKAECVLHDCTQDQRLDRIERDVAAHDTRIKAAEDALAAGAVVFAEVRKDLAQIQLTLAEIRAKQEAGPSLYEKLVDAAIHWGVPAAILGIVWVLAKSGQVPRVH